MEFRDLKTQYAQLKADIDAAIARVVDSAHFIGGPEVSRLEEDLAAYVGVRHCITCGNGTDALQLALMAWGGRTWRCGYRSRFHFFFEWRSSICCRCNSRVC